MQCEKVGASPYVVLPNSTERIHHRSVRVGCHILYCNTIYLVLRIYVKYGASRWLR